MKDTYTHRVLSGDEVGNLVEVARMYGPKKGSLVWMEREGMDDMPLTVRLVKRMDVHYVSYSDLWSYEVVK